MKYIFLIFFSLIIISTYCSFQTSLFKELNKEFTNKNLIISPLSAYQVLGIATNGAKGNTLEQMLLALGNKNLNELNKINVDVLKVSKQFSTIEIANALMTAVAPKKKFLNAVSKYEATVSELKSASQINKWCSIKTRGKIKKLISSLNPMTKMILLNAIHFKGEWVKEFDIKKTSKRPFYNCNDKSKETQVDIMSTKNNFNYYGDSEAQIIELPYKKDSMSAVIILPRKESVNDYISKLNDEKLQNLLERMHSQEVTIDLPKFQLEFSSSLKKALQKLGMTTPFTEDADFKEINQELILYIFDVVQKTFLKVDEKGTEAAAATYVDIGANSLPLEMNINKPFLFMIRNKKLPKNYQLLFMSKIENLK